MIWLLRTRENIYRVKIFFIFIVAAVFLYYSIILPTCHAYKPHGWPSYENQVWTRPLCTHAVLSFMSLMKLFDSRPDECKDCLSFDFRTLINPADSCSIDRQIDVLVIVPTTPSDFDQREALRKTWLGSSSNNTGHIFLLGTTMNRTVQEKLVKESLYHKDILQSDFIDTFRNLTIKIITGIKWAVRNCQNISYILKTDSDVLLNIYKWRQIMFGTQKQKLNNVLFGRCLESSIVSRVPFHKYGLSIKTFSKPTFPPFCHGPSYGMSLQLGKEIVETSYRQRFIPLEDSYIGTCLEKLGRRVYNLPHYKEYNLAELRATADDALCSLIRDLYIVLDVKANNLLQHWQSIVNCYD